MSYKGDCIGEYIYICIYGIIVGVIKGDTRSLDYSLNGMRILSMIISFNGIGLVQLCLPKHSILAA